MNWTTIAILFVSFCSSAIARDFVARSQYGTPNVINRNEYMVVDNLPEGSFTPIFMTKRKLIERHQEEPRYVYRSVMNRGVYESQNPVVPTVYIPMYRQDPIFRRPFAYETPSVYPRTSLSYPLDRYAGRRTIYPRCFQSFYDFFGLSPKPKPVASHAAVDDKPVSVVAVAPPEEAATTTTSDSVPVSASLEPEIAAQQAEVEVDAHKAEAEATVQKEESAAAAVEAEADAQKTTAPAEATTAEVETTKDDVKA